MEPKFYWYVSFFREIGGTFSVQIGFKESKDDHRYEYLKYVGLFRIEDHARNHANAVITAIKKAIEITSEDRFFNVLACALNFNYWNWNYTQYESRKSLKKLPEYIIEEDGTIS